MWGEVFKVVAAAAATAVAYYVGNKIVQQNTGKQIHEHVFEWWCEVRDAVSKWMHNHPNIPLLGVLGIFDDLACAAKKGMDGIFKVRAYDTKKSEYVVTEVRVSREEAEQKFPELKSKPYVVLTHHL